MKKQYIEPTLNTVRINCTQMLALSNGGYGNSGDDAESKRFQGGLMDDEEPVRDSWY